MAFLLSDIFRTGRGRNLFVSGKPGTGKTVCVKYVLREMRTHAEQQKVALAAVYVNAGKTRSPYYTMLEIVKDLGLDVPESGWQMFRLKHAFENVIEERPVVVAVDEVETLLLKEKEPLVYHLNRQPKTTLILVSNKVEDAADLPDRALSTLQLKLLLLEPYTAEEAKTILTERAEKALQPGAISDKLLDVVAEVASKAKDIRLGFSILLSAGFMAEKAGKTKVEAEDVESAVESETRLGRIKGVMERIKELRGRLKRRGMWAEADAEQSSSKEPQLQIKIPIFIYVFCFVNALSNSRLAAHLNLFISC